MALVHGAKEPLGVSSGLVLYLDAANARSYPRTGLTWFDRSGNGNNGTLEGGVVYSGSNFGTLTFDGTDDYVNSVTPTSLGIGLASNSFTISIWFKTTGNNEYYLFDNYNGFNDRNISLRLAYGAFSVYVAGTGASISATIGSGYNNNAWHNFSITWNGSNLLTMYANGSTIGSNTTTLSGSFENYLNPAFQIGRRPASSSHLPGNISQVSVYNRALSATEIAQNYNALKGRYI